MITGIVLSAGRSRRMGQPKALLPNGSGTTLLEHAVRVLRDGGCDEVLVVAGGPAQQGWSAIRSAAHGAGARVCVNPDPQSEQLESLRVALRGLDARADAVVVTPVDLPRLEARVVGALIAAWLAGAAPVVLPTHGGQRGHPVLFARAVFAELLRERLPEGARSVIRAHEAALCEVPVATPGIRQDVDTPADYRRLVASPERGIVAGGDG